MGKCKTRLAKTVGDKVALEVYHKLLKHTRRVVLELDIYRYLFYDQHIQKEDDWSNDAFIKQLQFQGHLGDRLHHAFKKVLANHQKAIVIGSDCPKIKSVIIQDAFDKLEENDFVIGPTLDGGYYLLGMKIFSPTLFEEINWSTSVVFDQTVSKIKSLNKTFELLPTLSDLDNYEDLLKFPKFNPTL